MICVRSLLFLALAACLLSAGCAQQPVRQAAREGELAVYPADDLEGVLTPSAVVLDSDATADGRGSFRISVSEPATVALYEASDLTVENATLIYRAELRSADLDGRAYLEMWCSFGEQGDYFSRGLDAPISGTSEWTTRETPFFLQPGQDPTLVKLNLVIEGTGTVWIDDIRLLKTALP